MEAIASRRLVRHRGGGSPGQFARYVQSQLGTVNTTTAGLQNSLNTVTNNERQLQSALANGAAAREESQRVVGSHLGRADVIDTSEHTKETWT